MGKLSLLQYERLGIRQGDFTNFNFEALQPKRGLRSMISEYDMKNIHDVCLDPRMNNKLKQKEEIYESILNPRGFFRMGRGTNRVIFKDLEDQSIVLKIPLSEAGKLDGPSEMKNQWLIKPFCTKIFEVSPDGLITVAERGELIRSQEIFYSFGDQLYDFYEMFLGKYVMADVGTEFRKNWVIRPGFGPILCDFPLIYPLDGTKLFCDEKDLITGIPCGGEIDYDLGFNRLYCKKCGKQYFASSLAKQLESGLIKRRRCSSMKIKVNVYDENNKQTSYSSEKIMSTKTFIANTEREQEKAKCTTKVSSNGGLKFKVNTVEEEKQKIVVNTQYPKNDVKHSEAEASVQTEPKANTNTINANTEIKTVVDVCEVPESHRSGNTCDEIMTICNELYNGDVQKYVDFETNAIQNQQNQLTVMFSEIEELKQKYLDLANQYNEKREENIKRTEALEEFITLTMNQHIEVAEQIVKQIEEKVVQQETEVGEESKKDPAQEMVDEYSAYLEEQYERLIKEYGFARETVNEVLDRTGFNVEEAEKILQSKKENMEKSREQVEKIRNRGGAPFKNNSYADDINRNSESKYPAKGKKQQKENNDAYLGY